MLSLTGTVLLSARAADEKPKYTIKQVIKQAMSKNGLATKVADGKASDADTKKLLEMFKALSAQKPPQGEEESRKEKTGALVSAAEKFTEKMGDVEELKKAANCMECHKGHKKG